MLSVIICTRNRAEKLAQCVRSFEEAQAPTGDWELLVVDNASRDQANEVVNLQASDDLCPTDLEAIPHPRIGFTGSINLKVDLSLIATLASRKPEWYWVLNRTTLNGKCCT